MKVLGLIGTLDPYKHKLNQGSIEDALTTARENLVRKEMSEYQAFDALRFVTSAVLSSCNNFMEISLKIATKHH